MAHMCQGNIAGVSQLFLCHISQKSVFRLITLNNSHFYLDRSLKYVVLWHLLEIDF